MAPDAARGPLSSRARGLVLLASLVLVALLLAAWQARLARQSGLPWQAAVVVAAPNVFSGPVNGGCYLDSATTCRLHVDSWQPITVSAGQTLRAFQLRATGEILYDFRTDVANPPGGSYLPSLVKQDFAITCGETYVLTLLAQDTGDAALVTVGQTNAFSCPAAATPTPTPTATPTATPTPTPTASGTPPPESWRLWLPVFWR